MVFIGGIPILCVDDNPVILEWLERGLSAGGFKVDAARSGFAALATLSRHSHRYPVVVTDLRMPGLDGVGLIEQSRAAGYLGSFVVYSAAITPEIDLQLRELRVRFIVAKPSPFSKILDAVRDASSGY